MSSVLAKVVNELASLRGEVAELRRLAVTPKVKEKKWLKLKEAADVLNTSQKTVRRYIEKGFLHRSAVSRHILIPAEDVENLIDKVLL